ncbi:Ran-binding protein 10 [Portunus trituberculatus]|uniref:Ran-binding protein 10 n=1 Tax=Portunus trituberculatus TaxID=210409 RepID=A0A5B7KCA2_PORTR|nr:Ran-binding protein 10 [Portunus trituberculatus]
MASVLGNMGTAERGVKMAALGGRHSASPPLFSSLPGQDAIKSLYPMVNEEETPLPRCWSSKDKYSFIGLSQNNLRVHYKGKTQRWLTQSLFIFAFHAPTPTPRPPTPPHHLQWYLRCVGVASAGRGRAWCGSNKEK